jgi:hypothetical protein
LWATGGGLDRWDNPTGAQVAAGVALGLVLPFLTAAAEASIVRRPQPFIDAQLVAADDAARAASAAPAATVALLLTAVALGPITPRLSRHSWAWGSLQPGSDLVHMQIRVTNDAWASTELVGGGESVPGLRLVATTVARGDAAALPEAADLAAHLERDEAIVPDRSVSLGPGDQATPAVVWQVTDCASVPADPGPVPVRLRTPLGLTRTVDGPSGLGVDELGADVSWTVELARDACGQTGDGHEP